MARILIADDEDLERTALRFIIEHSELDERWTIDEARNGLEAVRLGTEGGYDAIFLDIRMPGTDGLQAALALREAGVESPIVIVSAYDTFEYAQRAIRLGVYEYLLKPAGRDEVLAALSRTLGERRSAPSMPRSAKESLKALDEAAARLESILTSQLSAGALDDIVATEFETLAGLAGTVKTAFAFSLKGAETDAGGANVERAIAAGVAASIRRLVEGDGSRLCLSASSERFGALLIYGWGFEGSAEAGDERSGKSGAARDRRADARDRLYEAAHRFIRDNSRLELRCGAAGPSLARASEVFARAAEGASLASAEMPFVKLAALGRAESTTSFSADAGKPRSLAMRALELLRRDFTSEITLQKAAELLGVSQFHLSRAISRELGMGFNEILNRMRINKAKELLAGGASAKEASHMVGFADQAYFTRVFKRIEGIGPRRFVELAQKSAKSR